jgi:putative FmdB family regulatory protein
VPLYDYQCDSCGHIFELRQSFSAATEGPCPRCEGNSRRRFHAVPIIYKGSGFYTTDYKKTGYSPPGKTEDSSPSHGHDHDHSHGDSGSKEEVASSPSSDSD